MKTKSKYKFFQDLFLEEADGKYSSKKIWGAVVMLLIAAAFIIDGLDFYIVNVNLFNTMALIGTTLIGLNTVSSMFTKK